MTSLNAGMDKVLKRLHYPLDVMLTCVRWYVAYPLSLRHLEEMMAERGVSVDHSTVHRWAIKLLPALEKTFRRHKRAVGRSWRMDETYVKVNGEKIRQAKYLNNVVEQDHQAIKRRTGPMLGFKNFRCARILLGGIEVMHMIKKGQMMCHHSTARSAAQKFYALAA
jgi:transposase-like protein